MLSGRFLFSWSLRAEVRAAGDTGAETKSSGLDGKWGDWGIWIFQPEAQIAEECGGRGGAGQLSCPPWRLTVTPEVGWWWLAVNQETLCNVRVEGTSFLEIPDRDHLIGAGRGF